MKAIEFKEVNVRIAENQPEYETLPVHIDLEDPATPTTMCIQLDPEEIKQVLETGLIWLSTLTFGQSFHPIRMSFLKPENYTDPCLVICESCEKRIELQSSHMDSDANYFCDECWDALAPVMKAEYEEMVNNGEIEE